MLSWAVFNFTQYKFLIRRKLNKSRNEQTNKRRRIRTYKQTNLRIKACQVWLPRRKFKLWNAYRKSALPGPDMFQVILSKTLIRPSKHSVGLLHRSYHPLSENQWCKMEPGFTTGKTKPIFYIHICACAEVRIYCWHDLLKVGKSNFPYLYCYLYHEIR